jgi:hypothetical protein
MLGGVLIRGIRLMDLEKLPSVASNIKRGSLRGLMRTGGASGGGLLISCHCDRATLRWWRRAAW